MRMNSNWRTVAAAAFTALAACSGQEDTDGARVPSATEQQEPAATAAPARPATQPSAAEIPAAPAARPQQVTEFDPRNATILIDGTPVALTNGVSRVPAAPGSAGSTTTRYLGRDARGDLTGDGMDEVAYFVARDAAGSGVFYYVVVGIDGPTGHRTTNAFLVGDRIEPQSLRINAGELHVNYVGRQDGEAMTTPPSRESVLLLKVTRDGRLQGLMK